MTVDLQIAVATPLHQTFTYHHDEALTPGVRVLVPFGRQARTLGVVVSAAPPADATGPRTFKIKYINSVLDAEPVYSLVLMRLAEWLSQYYMHPVGEVLRAMLPASNKKSTKVTYELTGDGANAPEDLEVRPVTMFARKSTVSEPTLKNRLKDHGLSAEESGRTIKTWLRKGWITVARERKIAARSAVHLPEATVTETTATEATITETTDAAANAGRPVFQNLNARQQAAFDTIVTRGLRAASAADRCPFLLFGVTGSGKTEVFLHTIRELIDSSADQSQKAQSLVLVPEISLTPQMTRIFEERFPGKVAVVHSAMEDDERWRELDRVRRGEALVLIGPRSAVFGPFANLKLIIVDEEHDGSYKQGSGLLYNARDVAIVRAGLENATVVLGSATPSMESWNNAVTGKYQLIEMPDRASTKPLPEIETLPARPAFKAISFLRGDSGSMEHESPFADEVINALRENLSRKQQSIVLVNRRGYAYYLMSVEDRKAAGCPKCSISLSVHSKKKILRCHYCGYNTTVQKIIADSPDKTWAVVGYGSQKAEDVLKSKIPEAQIARLDSDTVLDPKALPEILGKFRAGEIDILVGTQILAKGHDFPNVTLIAILEVDQLLGLPDFRGGERTFQLLVQAAGRSGRGQLAGKVLLQSMRCGHPVVQTALRQDFKAFAEIELEFRKALGYPPFGRMIQFEFNGSDPRKLDQWCSAIEDSLLTMLESNSELARCVRVLGPAPAPIEVIRGRTRRTIMIVSPSRPACRTVATHLQKLVSAPPGDIRVKIDVDPQSTL